MADLFGIDDRDVSPMMRHGNSPGMSESGASDPVTDRLRSLLADAEFPAGRNDLVRHVEERGRPGGEEDAIHRVLVLPEGTYVDLDEVLSKLADDPDRPQRTAGLTSGPQDVVADDD